MSNILKIKNGNSWDTIPAIKGDTGATGEDGYSPTASVSKSGDTATITVTDKNGTTTASVSDGATGATGADGYSPSASVSKSGSVSTLTVTDKNGTTTVQINDGSNATLTILSYGSSTWADFIAAYTANSIVYCRASSGSNPGTGTQGRMAFMAYVNDATTPTEVEFQYYRSVATHSDNQQGDQVYVYKLTSAGVWSVTTREAYTKIAAGTKMSSSYSSGTLTMNFNGHDLPSGGTQGQVLKKSSATDYDVAWGNESGSSDSVVWVNFTENNSTWSSSKSTSQIYSALEAGQTVLAKDIYGYVYSIDRYPSSSSSNVVFQRASMENDTYIELTKFTVKSTGVVNRSTMQGDFYPGDTIMWMIMDSGSLYITQCNYGDISDFYDNMSSIQLYTGTGTAILKVGTEIPDSSYQDYETYYLVSCVTDWGDNPKTTLTFRGSSSNSVATVEADWYQYDNFASATVTIS